MKSAGEGLIITGGESRHDAHLGIAPIRNESDLLLDQLVELNGFHVPIAVQNIGGAKVALTHPVQCAERAVRAIEAAPWIPAPPAASGAKLPRRLQFPAV